jgi:glycosyltransferase involved in cell wall biosynthesis
LRAYVCEMERSGAAVNVRPYRHSESEGLEVLARAKCAVLPYPRHDGMSRVLLEACSVGTPVIVHDRGLVGYLVRRYKLGRAVDCTDARALRRAILALVSTDDSEPHSAHLADFAARFSAARFEASILAPFRQDREELSASAFV